MQDIGPLLDTLSTDAVALPLSDRRRKALNLLFRGQVGSIVLDMMASRYHVLPLHVAAPLAVRAMLGDDIPDGSIVDFIGIIMTALLTGVYDTEQMSISRVERTISRSESRSNKKRPVSVPLRTGLLEFVMKQLDRVWFEELRRFTGSDLMVALSKPLLCNATDEEWSDWLRALTQSDTQAMSQRVCMRLLRECEIAWLHCIQTATGMPEQVRNVVAQYIDARCLVPGTARTVVCRADSTTAAPSEYELMLSKAAMRHREEIYTDWALATHLPVSHRWDRLCEAVPTDACAGKLPVQVHADAVELVLHKALVLALSRKAAPDAVYKRSESWFNDWLIHARRLSAESALLTDKDAVAAQLEACSRTSPADAAAEDPAPSAPAEAAAAAQ